MQLVLEAIEKMSPEQRQGALEVLDLLSRPLTMFEIDAAMIGRGITRSQRRIVSRAVAKLHIIALAGPEKAE
ncbi:hypothetical protein [Croceicoccus marinus]|jgi:hypothetical protein|uniref:Uncharacterized protein n=1 Tax=Croceicoccus marinus TaxID=450378 RepID=A0A7G6VSG9_9SPHN|nr:hypothetical protein [Croceicoccus marinus]QNE04684.1 hypothetical protein H4O24_12065 [Croceicoccus marinus]